MQILGPPSQTLEQLQQAVAVYNPHPRFVNEMMPALYREAIRYGINPGVPIGQSGHETGWGRFKENNPTGVIDASFYNTAGIKTRAGGGDYDPDAHMRFPNWDTGARAHMQHLYAYMRKLPPDDIVDPRWDWVYGVKGPISTVEELDAWASHSNYGNRILEVMRRLGVSDQPIVKTMKKQTYARRPD